MPLINDRSKYTVTLQDIIETYHVKLPLYRYPCISEKQRDELNHLIIGEYYFNEIAYPSVGQFLQRLEHKLMLIMPYYNRIYELEADIDDLFNNVDLVTKQRTYENTDSTQNTDFSESISDDFSRVDQTGSETNSDTIENANDDLSRVEQSDTDVNSVAITNADGTSDTTENKTSNEDQSTGETNNQNTILNDFIVDSTLPQNFVSTSDIQNNQWASQARKQNQSQDIRGSSDGTRNTDNTGHGETNVVTEDNSTTNGESVTDIENQIGEIKDSNHDNSQVSIQDIENQIGDLRENNRDNSSILTSNIDNMGKLIRKIKGMNGGKYKVELIELAKNSVWNVNQMILDDLRPLFMGIY